MKIATTLLTTAVLTLTLAAPASATTFNNLSEITSELLNRQVAEMRESIKVQTKQALENSVRLVAEHLNVTQATEVVTEQLIAVEANQATVQPKAE